MLKSTRVTLYSTARIFGNKEDTLNMTVGESDERSCSQPSSLSTTIDNRSTYRKRQGDIAEMTGVDRKPSNISPFIRSYLLIRSLNDSEISDLQDRSENVVVMTSSVKEMDRHENGITNVYLTSPDSSGDDSNRSSIKEGVVNSFVKKKKPPLTNAVPSSQSNRSSSSLQSGRLRLSSTATKKRNRDLIFDHSGPSEIRNITSKQRKEKNCCNRYEFDAVINRMQYIDDKSHTKNSTRITDFYQLPEIFNMTSDIMDPLCNNGDMKKHIIISTGTSATGRASNIWSPSTSKESSSNDKVSLISRFIDDIFAHHDWANYQFTGSGTNAIGEKAPSRSFCLRVTVLGFSGDHVFDLAALAVAKSANSDSSSGSSSSDLPSRHKNSVWNIVASLEGAPSVSKVSRKHFDRSLPSEVEGKFGEHILEMCPNPSVANTLASLFREESQPKEVMCKTAFEAKGILSSAAVSLLSQEACEMNILASLQPVFAGPGDSIDAKGGVMHIFDLCPDNNWNKPLIGRGSGLVHGTSLGVSKRRQHSNFPLISEICSCFSSTTNEASIKCDNKENSMAQCNSLSGCPADAFSCDASHVKQIGTNRKSRNNSRGSSVCALMRTLSISDPAAATNVSFLLSVYPGKRDYEEKKFLFTAIQCLRRSPELSLDPSSPKMNHLREIKSRPSSYDHMSKIAEQQSHYKAPFKIPLKTEPELDENGVIDKTKIERDITGNESSAHRKASISKGNKSPIKKISVFATAASRQSTKLASVAAHHGSQLFDQASSVVQNGTKLSSAVVANKGTSNYPSKPEKQETEGKNTNNTYHEDICNISVSRFQRRSPQMKKPMPQDQHALVRQLEQENEILSRENRCLIGKCATLEEENSNLEAQIKATQSEASKDVRHRREKDYNLAKKRWNEHPLIQCPLQEHILTVHKAGESNSLVTVKKDPFPLQINEPRILREHTDSNAILHLKMLGNLASANESYTSICSPIKCPPNFVDREEGVESEEAFHLLNSAAFLFTSPC